MALYVTRFPKWIAKDKGTDTITMADGLITIRINKIQGNQVQLSIDCPRDIDIKRGEQNAQVT